MKSWIGDFIPPMVIFVVKSPTQNSANSSPWFLGLPMSAGLLGVEKYDAFAVGLGHQGSRL